MYWCRTKHHIEMFVAGNCDLVKESMGSFFLATDHKKGGKKEATSQKMKASLEHVETEFQLG